MTIYIGIDPGATGAIALIDAKSRSCEVVDMPLHPTAPPKKKPVGKKKKKPPALVDGRKLAKILGKLDTANTLVIIEKVGAMPGQGVSSMFNFGNSAGVARGVCEAMGFEVVFVSPQVWKKSHGLIGTVKDASRVLAIKKHPALANELKRKRDGGRADALLIARWGAGTKRIQ